MYYTLHVLHWQFAILDCLQNEDCIIRNFLDHICHRVWITVVVIVFFVVIVSSSCEREARLSRSFGACSLLRRYLVETVLANIVQSVRHAGKAREMLRCFDEVWSKVTDKCQWMKIVETEPRERESSSRCFDNRHCMSWEYFKHSLSWLIRWICLARDMMNSTNQRIGVRSSNQHTTHWCWDRKSNDTHRSTSVDRSPDSVYLMAQLIVNVFFSDRLEQDRWRDEQWLLHYSSIRIHPDCLI
jgi:hypothetical protein